MPKKSINIIATVILQGQTKKTQAGRIWCNVPVRVLKTGEIYNCILFEQLAFLFCRLTDSTRVSISGNNETGTNDLFVTSFTDETQKKVASRPIAELKKANEAVALYNSNHGFVLIEIDKNRTWVTKEACIKRHDGSYTLKIEHLMDILGPAKVTTILREFLKDKNPFDLAAIQQSGVKQYIDKLIEENTF